MIPALLVEIYSGRLPWFHEIRFPGQRLAMMVAGALTFLLVPALIKAVVEIVEPRNKEADDY